MKIPVIASQSIKSWPKHDKGGRATYTELSTALIAMYRTDAHFAQYSVPEIERRLALAAVSDPDARAKLPGGAARMVIVAFDVDAEISHRASGGTGAPAPDTWWLAELEKIDALREVHPGAFVYRTRGGYRIVYVLAQPFELRADTDAAAWTLKYLQWCAYIHREFDIVADPGCKEWVRLFRYPHATREEGGKPERREIVGDPSAIGLWACEPSAEDCEVARQLSKKKTQKKKRERKGKPAQEYSGDGVLFHAFNAKGWIGSQLEPGKWSIRCPREHEHSRGETFDTSTILWAPGPGEENGWIHCSHGNSGHDRLTLREWISEFTEEEIKAARKAAGLPEKEESQPDWMSGLLLTDKGDFRTCLANTMHVLTMHPEWKDVLAYDDFAECVLKLKRAPVREQDDVGASGAGEWTETDTTRARSWFASVVGFEPSNQDVEGAIAAVAEKFRVHPVRDYLAACEWDGQERIDRVFVTYFGATDSEYVRAVGARFMISAVARVFKPGCQVDHLPVLEGEQGIRKSTGAEALFGKDWFADTGISVGDKDSYQALRRKWGYEFGELSSLKGREVERVKNFISARVDNYRPSFGRRNRDFPRQVVFIGTTNDSEYLVDRTGNRRFWPVRCGARVDVDAIRRDRDQLWAEARVRFAQGERWHVDTAELRRLCEQEQRERESVDPWVEIVSKWLDAPTVPAVGSKGYERERLNTATGITTADVLLGALDFRKSEIRQDATTRVGHVLRRLGWKPEGQRRDPDGSRPRVYMKASAQPAQPTIIEGCATGVAEKLPEDEMSQLSQLNSYAHRKGEEVPPGYEITSSRGNSHRAVPAVPAVTAAYEDDERAAIQGEAAE